jgi:hypothetical protein
MNKSETDSRDAARWNAMVDVIHADTIGMPLTEGQLLIKAALKGNCISRGKEQLGAAIDEALAASVPPPKPRVVVCAANKWSETIVTGARHFDSIMHSQIARMFKYQLPPTPGRWQQGFIDQYGVFMDRREAWQVAEAAGQIVYRCGGDGEKLFSENLY